MKNRNDLSELNDILLAKLLSKRYARKKYKQWDNQRNWRRKP